jgi:hypothetical protein
MSKAATTKQEGGELMMSATKRFELLKSEVFREHSGKTPQKKIMPRKIKRFPSLNGGNGDIFTFAAAVSEAKTSPPTTPVRRKGVNVQQEDLSQREPIREAVLKVSTQFNRCQQTDDLEFLCPEGVVLTPTAKRKSSAKKHSTKRESKENTPLHNNDIKNSPLAVFDHALYTGAVFNSYSNKKDVDNLKGTAESHSGQIQPPKRQISQSHRDIQKYGDKLSRMVDKRRLAARLEKLSRETRD